MTNQVMDCKAERALGMELAKKHGYTATLAVIENPKSSAESIFESAFKESQEKGTMDLLISTVLEGPFNWSHLLMLVAPDVEGKDQLLKKVSDDSTPPREIGWGYNTYFVNQAGKELWIMYNTGMSGGNGPFTGPSQLNKDQNVGWGRGGTCISEVRVWTSKPDDWNTTGILGSWSLPQGANGCKSWGYRIDNTGIVESIQGDSMPDKYPPSNGEGS